MTIDIAVARSVLKADGDDDAIILRDLASARSICEGYCNRKFYDTQEQSDADFLVAVTDLQNAEYARDASIEAAATEHVAQAYRSRYITIIGKITQRINGIVVDDTIEAAILMTLGHLYMNRQDVVVGNGVVAIALPIGAQRVLQPYLWIGALADGLPNEGDGS